jgi:TfoX/Sxy family transcriptional regulator of competence genes
MAYDEKLALRVREALDGVGGSERQRSERKMFGGICFMVDGHMALGILGDELMVRVGPEAYQAALSRPHVRPMDFTGRPMAGIVFVGPRGCAGARALAAWVGRALAFVDTLPTRR